MTATSTSSAYIPVMATMVTGDTAAIAALAAEAVGIMAALHALTVDYLKTRQQFGKPIGEYQSVAFAIARMEARAHVARVAYYDAAAKIAKHAVNNKMTVKEATIDLGFVENGSITEADLDTIRNVCRCGTYPRIRDAIKAGAQRM